MVWFSFLYLKFIVKNRLRFYWGKICSIHYLHFSFEKHVPSQVFKDFSVENLETTPSKFSPQNIFSEIYLSLIINYWGSIFTFYLTWGAFSLVCAVSVFSFFLIFTFFYWYFPWQTLTIHRIAGMGEGIIIFLVFHFHPLTNIHLVHRDFYHFFLINLFVITRLIADETSSPERFAFYFHFYWWN